MNAKQARTLADLLEAALPERRWDNDPEPDVYARINHEDGYARIDDGSDTAYSVAIFSPSDALCSYAPVWIRGDGSLAIADEDGVLHGVQLHDFTWRDRGHGIMRFDAHAERALLS